MRGKMPPQLKILKQRGRMKPTDLLWCQCNVHPVLSCKVALIRCPLATRTLCDPPTCTSTLFSHIGHCHPFRPCLAAPATRHKRKLLSSAWLGFQLTALLQFTFFALCSSLCMLHGCACQGRSQAGAARQATVYSLSWVLLWAASTS